MNVAYCADCLPELRKLPDKAFELAVVDPPYNLDAANMSMGSNLHRHGDGYPGESTAQRLKKGRLCAGAGKLSNRALQTMDCSWNQEPPPAEYFEQLFRVSRHQVIWGGNYFHLPPTRGILVWDKNQPWDNFSQAEIAWTSCDFPAQVFLFSNRGGRNDIAKIHPTQKPIELYRWVYERLERWDVLHKGDRILDTHLGSGTSRRAAYDMGYDFTGYEKNQAYFDMQEEEFARHTAQVSLFLEG